MKQFNPKTDILESETALALVRSRQKAIKQYSLYMGLDVHKDTIAVSLASADGSKPRYYGEIANTQKAVEKLISKLNPDSKCLEFVTKQGLAATVCIGN
jgi:hypothetical protein